MALIPSLCAALERVAGDRVTLREGEPPHVAAGNDRHPIARSPLTHAAIQAMLEEILTPEGRRALAETGVATETLDKAPIRLTVKAALVDRQFAIELLRADAPASAPAAGPEPAPAAQPTPTPTPTPITTATATATATANPTPAPANVSVEPPPAPPVIPAAAAVIPSTPVTPEPLRMIQTPVPTPVAAPVATVIPPSSQPREPHPTSPSDLAGWTAYAMSLGAGALYLRAGQTPVARIADRMEPIGGEALDAAAIDRMAQALNAGDSRWRAGSNGEWISEDQAHGQAICQLVTDHLGTALVIRLRQRVSASLLDRQIPRQVRIACDGDGLVLASANNLAEMLAVGSALTDWSGRRRGAYVIALRPKGSPVHEIGGAFVSQREFEGGDAEVAAAVRRAAQEAPDVLLIVGAQGERTMREAITASSASRLVILGIVAPTTPQALRAVAAQGDADTAAEHLGLLVQTFRAGFSLRGLRRLGGGRTYICDVAVAHPEVNALMTLGDFAGVARVQGTGTAAMRTIDSALARAVVRGHLSLRQAAGQAAEPSLLVQSVRKLRRATRRTGTQTAQAPAAPDTAADIDVSLDQESMMAGVASGATTSRRWSRFGR